ncbi:TPA: hypothetical protein ACFOU7_002026, partial [Neisseria meningitidis]
YFMVSQGAMPPAGIIVLSPVGESQREDDKPQGLYFRRLRDLGKIAATWKMPSPQPSPAGEGEDCGRFGGCRRFEKQLGFTTVDAGRLKKKKTACTS